MDASPLTDLDTKLATPPLQRSSGRLEVAWRRRGTVTGAERVFQDGVAKARLPRDHGRGCPDVALINLAGGLTGGDRLDQRITWGPGTRAGATTQAAEKIYRALDDTVAVATRLEVRAGAWGEWLPQETILFEGASLDRRLDLDLAADARLLAVEPVVFGRLAMGEEVGAVHLRDRIVVRVDGRLVWHDVTLIEPPNGPLLDHPALGGGARAFATLLYVGADAPAALDLLRALVEATGVPGGVTCMAPVLVARLHHPDPLALRQALVHVLAKARARLGGLPERLPRLWHS